MKKWQKIVFSVCMSAILCISATGCDTIKWLLSPQEQSLAESLTAVETVYAKAQELGFEGTLEEFLELVKGADGKDGVGVSNAYLENGDLVVELTNGKKINCGVIVERATHTVSFDANGGEKIPSQEVKHGEKADKPTDPKKEGYIFDGWYIGEEKWSFIGYSVTEDITLTAKWMKIEDVLAGKKISILGDSISTLEGISDNVAYNTTLSPNQSRYYAKDVAYTTTEATLELTSWEDTYWGQTVNDLNLELCVNNSWRGTSVSTARGASSCTSGTRATQLHNDNENIMPDIIVIYIGTNDKNSKAPVFGYNSIDDVYDGASYTADCSYFDIAYATMVLKVKNKYPNADIYLCNLIYNDTLGQSYNKSIEKIATEFDCNLVDFSSLVPVWSWSGHTMDGLHPNKDGFDLMADILTCTIQETYMQN